MTHDPLRAAERAHPCPEDATTGESTLSRREFLGTGALVGGAVVMGGAAACSPPDRGRDAARASREAEVAASSRPWPVPEFELDEVSITELHAGMVSGRWSSEEITALYLRRIEELDRRGPTLRSVIETNPEALEIARERDREREAGQVRGCLHGIPILLKDNIATHDRMTTTAGSLALEGSIPLEDSFLARRLREGGAILIGKANLSEWANYRSSRSSSGWSGRGGQCRNPYVLDRNPCGSSSGSGAAVSANLCAGAVGTETNGSIVCPSSANGVVGIKPTVGLVSRTRIVPISYTQDTAGPMCRSVRDAAMMLGCMTGVDPEDPATAGSDGRAHHDYTTFLDAHGLAGARIGVATQYSEGHEAVEALFDQALAAMRDAGATVVDIPPVDGWRQMGRHSGVVMRYEFKAGLNAYLAALGPEAPVKTLDEVIAFNEANVEREMPWFRQEVFLECRDMGPLTDREYAEALAAALRFSRDEGIDRVMEEHTLDAIVAPSGGPAWTTDLINGDHYTMGSSSPAAIAGYPNISVPMGFVSELPVNLSFWGRAWSEPVLLRVAYGFEQRTGHRRKPRFIPTLGA